jgi:tRNA threonylcarbamoyladenosine biosynthesis protein TsaB
LAAQAPVSDGLIIPMIDARRNGRDIYSELESKRETRAEIIDEDSFGELTDLSILLVIA